MTGYDAATVEACAKVAEERREIFVVGPDVRTTVRFSPHEVAAAIRALPIARRADDRLAAVTANRDAMRELLTQLRDTGNFPAEWNDAFNAVLSHDPRG